MRFGNKKFLIFQKGQHGNLNKHIRSTLKSERSQFDSVNYTV